MDVSRLRQSEKIAAIAGIALIIIMFAFDWFSLKSAGTSVGNFSVGSVTVGANAWESFGFIDIILFLAALSAIALAFVRANDQRIDVPLSTIVTALGALGTLLVLFRILSPPDFNAPTGLDLDTGRKIGVFLGLIAVAALTYGGWQAMQEEGESFGDVGDRFSGGSSAGAPPPAAPPPAGPPAGEPPAGGPPAGGPPPAPPSGGPPAV
jgi:hypothetical protein